MSRRLPGRGGGGAVEAAGFSGPFRRPGPGNNSTPYPVAQLRDACAGCRSTSCFSRSSASARRPTPARTASSSTSSTPACSASSRGSRDDRPSRPPLLGICAAGAAAGGRSLPRRRLFQCARTLAATGAEAATCEQLQALLDRVLSARLGGQWRQGGDSAAQQGGGGPRRGAAGRQAEEEAQRLAKKAAEEAAARLSPASQLKAQIAAEAERAQGLADGGRRGEG